MRRLKEVGRGGRLLVLDLCLRRRRRKRGAKGRKGEEERSVELLIEP